jgi:hypothetical protein
MPTKKNKSGTSITRSNGTRRKSESRRDAQKHKSMEKDKLFIMAMLLKLPTAKYLELAYNLALNSVKPDKQAEVLKKVRRLVKAIEEKEGYSNYLRNLLTKIAGIKKAGGMNKEILFLVLITILAMVSGTNLLTQGTPLEPSFVSSVGQIPDRLKGKVVHISNTISPDEKNVFEVTSHGDTRLQQFSTLAGMGFLSITPTVVTATIEDLLKNYAESKSSAKQNKLFEVVHKTIPSDYVIPFDPFIHDIEKTVCNLAVNPTYSAHHWKNELGNAFIPKFVENFWDGNSDITTHYLQLYGTYTAELEANNGKFSKDLFCDFVVKQMVIPTLAIKYHTAVEAEVQKDLLEDKRTNAENTASNATSATDEKIVEASKYFSSNTLLVIAGTFMAGATYMYLTKSKPKVEVMERVASAPAVASSTAAVRPPSPPKNPLEEYVGMYTDSPESPNKTKSKYPWGNQQRKNNITEVSDAWKIKAAKREEEAAHKDVDEESIYRQNLNAAINIQKNRIKTMSPSRRRIGTNSTIEENKRNARL